MIKNAYEKTDWLGRREVQFHNQKQKVRRFVPRDKEADLSRKRIRSWHETLVAIWDDYHAYVLPEVKAMNLVRKYELKIEHEELKLRGAF